jgi:hypothetical protein
MKIYNDKAQVVGHIMFDQGIGHVVLQKRVKYREHHLHEPMGWATDASHIAALRMMGAELSDPDPVIRLTESSDRRWFARLSTYDRFGVDVNRGYGAQRALPDQYWQLNAVQAALV